MRAHSVVLIIFALLTLLLTYPLPLQMNTHLAGRDIDVWINPWADYWMKKAITKGLNLFYTDYQFYPQGVSLVFHSFSPLNTFLGWSLEPIIGTPAAYNLTVLLTYVLSGYGMWLLARYLTGNQFVALLAGAIFAFSPYHMIESAHLHLASTQWLPFFALFLIKAVQKGRGRDGVLAAVFLGLTALSSWHLFTFTILWALLYLAYTALFQRTVWQREKFQALSVFALLSLMFILPLLYPMLREQLTGGVAYMVVQPDEGVGNHLAGFFVPSQYHPLLSKGLTQVNQLLGKSSTRPAFVGYMVLLLALHAALLGGASTSFWALAALVFVLLSLGTHIPLRTGQSLPVPWAAPVVALWRHPFRFNVLISFCLSILAACDLTALLQGKAAAGASRLTKRRQILITGIVTTVVLFEYLTLPFPTIPLDVSPFYHQLAEEEGDFAVVEVPIGRQANKISLYAQTIHDKKLVGGHVSRTPVNAYDYIEQNLLLYAAWKGDPRTLSASDAAEGLAQLHSDNVRYVILNKFLLEDWAVDVWRDLLNTTPLYEDDKVAVYTTAAVGVRLAEDVIDVGPYQAVIVGSATYVGQWMSEAVKFVEAHRDALSQVPMAYFTVCLTLKDDTEENRCTVAAYLDPAREPVSQVQPVDAGPLCGEVGLQQVALPLLADSESDGGGRGRLSRLGGHPRLGRRIGSVAGGRIMADVGHPQGSTVHGPSSFVPYVGESGTIR